MTGDPGARPLRGEGVRPLAGALRGLAWPGALAVVAVAPFAWILATGHTFVLRDTARLYLPIRTLVSDALRAGRLPLWNPHEAGGKPLFAEGVHGVLHPLSLLAAVVDPGGVELLVILYVAAAALGAYVLGRVLDLGAPQAFVAGAGYGLSGFVLSMAGNLVFLAGAASLPWQVAALAAVGRGSPLALPGAALATAVTIFSGDAQVAAIGALLGAVLAAERGGRRALWRAAAGVVLGGLVAAVQIAATLVAVERSTRMWQATEATRAQWALSPWRLLELVLPGFFHWASTELDALVFVWLGGPTDYSVPFSQSIYVGVAVVALAAGAGVRPRRVTVLWGAAALLLWLALGHFAGATQALSWLPVWRQFRYTEKLVAPLSLVLALLAANGAAAATGRRARLRIAAAAALAAVSAVAAFAASAGDGPPALGAVRAHLAGGLPHTLVATAAVCAAALAPMTVRVRAVALALCVAAPLLAAATKACPPGVRAAIGIPPVEEMSAAPPGPRVATPLETTPRALAGATSPADVANRLSAVGVAAWNVRARLDQIDAYGALNSKRHDNLWAALGDDRWQLFRRYAVTHVVAMAPETEADARAAALATAGGRRVAVRQDVPLEVYEVPHRPWAFLPAAVARFEHPSLALQHLAASVRGGRDDVVVESHAPVPVGSGRVLSVVREEERVALLVEADSSALLVVNDAFWPGWRARIDGTPAPILAADILVRGVVVPAGRHQVTMAYEPDEVRWGGVLSLAGVVATAALGVRALRRREIPGRRRDARAAFP